MKKSIYLVTAMVLLSVLLAACSSGTSNETTTPGAFGNGTETGLGTPSTGLGTTGPSLGTPAATEAATSAATSAATKPATTSEATSAVNTPAATSATGGLGTTPGATSAPGATTNQPDAGRVKDLLKFDVQDQTGNKIGSVSNLVLNLDKGQCDYIIVSEGGVLGIGAKNIAVPCQLFTFPTASMTGSAGSTTGTGTGTGTGSSTSATATPATGGVGTVTGGTPATGSANESEKAENVLILKIDKAALDNAPKFDTATLPQLGQPAGDWDSALRTYWQQYNTTSAGSSGALSTPAAGLGTPAAGLGTPAAGLGTPAAGLGTPAAGTSGQATVAMKLQGVVLANQAIGMAVTDESNNRIGDVQDIVIDPTNCKLLYVVISFNGGTTGGTSLVPVPPTVFQLSGDGRSLVVANANTVLSGAPHFTTDQFPFTLTKDWDKEVKTYWQTHGGSNSTTP